MQPFYYSGDPYLSVMKGMYQALATPEPLIKLVGGPKTGKSRLCEKLAQFLRKKGRRVVMFDQVFSSPEQLRMALTAKLKLPDTHHLSKQLEETLAADVNERVTLIFDNVEKLNITTLLDIYRLAEIQTDSQPVLNIVLCADVSLDKRLASNADFRSLVQHISHSFVLPVMTQDALSHFYATYFAKSDMQEVRFESAALALAFKSTKGLPGAAAQIGKAIAQSRVGMQVLAAVTKTELLGFLKAMSLEGELGASDRIQGAGQWRVFMPVFAVLAVISAAYLFQMSEENDAVVESSPSVENAPVAAEQNSQENNNVQSVQSASPFADENPAEQIVDANVEITPLILQGTVGSDHIAQNAVGQESTAPFSDSSLALVTVAELGISEDEIVSSVFEDSNSGNAPDSSNTNLPTGQGTALTTANPEAIFVDDEPEEFASTDLSPANSAAELSGQPLSSEDSAALNNETLVAGQEQETAAPQQQEIATVQEQEAAEQENNTAIQTPFSAVENWLTHWQAQNLDAYFASYHEEFIPRYASSIQSWRQNRERNISRPASIELTLSDFEIIEQSTDRVEVTFWLAYASPTYEDDTQKRVVLEKEGDRWLIVTEVNLEVRR